MWKDFWQHSINYDTREITIYQPFADPNNNLVFKFPLNKSTISLCARIIVFLNWRC